MHRELDPSEAMIIKLIVRTVAGWDMCRDWRDFSPGARNDETGFRVVLEIAGP